jgi:hypothetical protein
MRSLSVCSLSLLLTLIAFSFSSCALSPSAQLKSDMKTVTAWAATARMAGESWLKGSVPRAYASQTLRAAQETIEDEAQTIQGQPADENSQLQSSLAGQARELGQVIDRMRASVESGDNNALTQLLKQLDAEAQALKASAEGGGVGP